MERKREKCFTTTTREEERKVYFTIQDSSYETATILSSSHVDANVLIGNVMNKNIDLTPV